MLFGRPLLVAQCVDLDVRMYYVTVQNLVYVCRSSDKTPIHSTQHVQHSIEMSIQVPTGLPEIVQQEYALFGGSGLYPRVNVVNTVHLSKLHSYYLQRRKRVRKDRSPVYHLIADDPDK